MTCSKSGMLCLLVIIQSRYTGFLFFHIGKNALTITDIQSILTFSMQQIKYIKSFSKGQVTIPKEVRDTLGIGENFWLKVSINDGKIIAEPVDEKKDKEDYRKELLSITDVFDLEPDIKQNREQLEK